MSPEIQPPQKKKQKTNPPKPPSPSFSSLPDAIVASCLARIPRSYYPKLSLVSKTFRSLILSRELILARWHINTTEKLFHVCLKLPDRLPSWYSLWIKPDQTLTNDIGEKRSTGKTLLVHSPSSYFPYVPMFIVTVGSEHYGLRQHNAPCPVLWIYNQKSVSWRVASRMTVARERPVAHVLDDKIYVMGGCDESANWAEVFDTKTQNWELLPDPGAELRRSSIRNLEVNQGKLYVRSSKKKKDYVYDPKIGKWDVARVSVKCVIENVCYFCDKKRFWWYDTKHAEWRMVRGLAKLSRNRHCRLIEIANYRGKLLILWDKFEEFGRENKDIWCTVIALESRNNGDEVWGKIEWASVVLKVPSSYVFVRSLVNGA